MKSFLETIRLIFEPKRECQDTIRKGKFNANNWLNNHTLTNGQPQPAPRYRYNVETYTIGGFLTTAGKLLFGGDGDNLVAWDPANGKPLWHAHIGAAGNAPETYVLDGHQYILATGGDQLFAFVLN